MHENVAAAVVYKVYPVPLLLAAAHFPMSTLQTRKILCPPPENSLERVELTQLLVVIEGS